MIERSCDVGVPSVSIMVEKDGTALDDYRTLHFNEIEAYAENGNGKTEPDPTPLKVATRPPQSLSTPTHCFRTFPGLNDRIEALPWYMVTSTPLARVVSSIDVWLWDRAGASLNCSA